MIIQFEAFARFVLLQCAHGLNWSEMPGTQYLGNRLEGAFFVGCSDTCEPELSKAKFCASFSGTINQKIHA